MPTYHYKCKACGHEFEVFQGMSEDSLTKCPSCGKKKLVRVISGSGLVFKGSGFYLTDYKKQGVSTSDSPKEKKQQAEAPAETTQASDGKKEKEQEKGTEKETGKEKEKGKTSSGPPSADKA